MARREFGAVYGLTLAEAGRRLGISRQRVFQLVRAGVLGTVQVSGRQYVSVVSLELYARWRAEQAGRGGDQ